MSIFDESEAWALPVTECGKYVGFISKSIIFNGYRSKLKMAKIE
jgi:CIC family chloride channel protein